MANNTVHKTMAISLNHFYAAYVEDRQKFETTFQVELAAIEGKSEHELSEDIKAVLNLRDYLDKSTAMLQSVVMSYDKLNDGSTGALEKLRGIIDLAKCGIPMRALANTYFGDSRIPSVKGPISLALCEIYHEHLLRFLQVDFGKTGEMQIIKNQLEDDRVKTKAEAQKLQKQISDYKKTQEANNGDLVDQLSHKIKRLTNARIKTASQIKLNEEEIRAYEVQLNVDQSANQGLFQVCASYIGMSHLYQNNKKELQENIDYLQQINADLNDHIGKIDSQLIELEKHLAEAFVEKKLTETNAPQKIRSNAEFYAWLHLFAYTFANYIFTTASELYSDEHHAAYSVFSKTVEIFDDETTSAFERMQALNHFTQDICQPFPALKNLAQNLSGFIPENAQLIADNDISSHMKTKFKELLHDLPDRQMKNHIDRVKNKAKLVKLFRIIWAKLTTLIHGEKAYHENISKDLKTLRQETSPLNPSSFFWDDTKKSLQKKSLCDAVTIPQVLVR